MNQGGSYSKPSALIEQRVTRSNVVDPRSTRQGRDRQGLIADGFVLVNGEPAKKSGQLLDTGAAVEVRIPPPVPSGLIPENIPLDIVFENDDLLVVNKPAGMVVHPAAGHDSGTLVHAVLDTIPRSRASAARRGRALSTASIKRPPV